MARFELVPLAELGRPRIDVLCNMSGIFRDSFQNVVELLDDLFQVCRVFHEFNAGAMAQSQTLFCERIHVSCADSKLILVSQPIATVFGVMPHSMVSRVLDNAPRDLRTATLMT